MTLRSRRRASNPKRLLIPFLLTIMAICGVGIYILFFESEKPTIDLSQTKEHFGQNSTIHYKVTDQKSGIKSITISGSQGSINKTIHSITFPRTTYKGAAGPLVNTESIPFDAKTLGFKDGPMNLTVEAVDFSFNGWFQGNKTVIEKQISIDTKPPRIQILHSEKYIIPGGAGIAIYKVTDKDTRHGVTINGYFNPGFLIGDGRDDTYISFFALPYDAPKIESLYVSAVDMADNKTTIPFSTVYKSDRKKRDKINISDGFLSSKIPEFQQYYPEMSGSFLEKYLYSNNTIRTQNNTKISELCLNPIEQRLWKDKFLRMAGSSRAGFADHRTYFYKGEAIDKQVHLGMDIASTRRADVKAANSGKVAFADYLGIYGNMVMVDHGQGVFSLYSHLSQINVAPGDDVERSAVLGLTGTSGMAGGDHLHFSMLVNGIFVTPKEWWDQHWVEVTIEEPITDSKF